MTKSTSVEMKKTPYLLARFLSIRGMEFHQRRLIAQPM